MQILSNGYKRPETGDLGDVWFPALEDNITRLNSHNHDGSNSEKLTSSSIDVVTDNVVTGDFAVNGTDWEATKTVPLGFEVDKTQIFFRDPTTKETMYLRIERLNITQFKVKSNQPVNAEVVYL